MENTVNNISFYYIDAGCLGPVKTSYSSPLPSPPALISPGSRELTPSGSPSSLRSRELTSSGSPSSLRSRELTPSGSPSSLSSYSSGQ